MHYVLASVLVILVAVVLALGEEKTAPSRAAPVAALPPLKVCLVSASAEYKSDASLGEFQKHLEANFGAVCTRVFGADKGDKLPGLEAIDSCDVMLVFTRRVTLPPEDLERVKKYFAAGRPLVGIRTASHAFQNWLELDKEVLGGNYTGHYGAGKEARIDLVEKAKDHPVLAGVKPFTSVYSLYKNQGAAADIGVLLTGTTKDATEPVAWTRMHQGGRIFYTSFGGPDDFTNENFRRMIVNALFWVANRRVEAKAGPSAAAPAKP